jgi:hypothetical protein
MMASHNYHSTKAVGSGRYARMVGQFSSSSSATDLRNISMRKSLITSQTTNPKDEGLTEVSLPFHVGMFLTDEPIDLSIVGGLELAIFLQKPEALFHGTAVTSSSNYTLSDVSLTLPLIYKSANDIAATPAEYVVEFLNWTSMFSVLDSTVSSIAQRLQLSGLVSAIHNSLPTQEINSTSYNGFALKNPGYERLTFLRDGQRSPLEKTTVVADDRAKPIENKSTTYPEVLQDYLSAWSPNRDLHYTQVIPENIKGIVNRDGVVGIGCNYSPDSAGINVSGVLGVDLQSKIEDVSTPNPAQTEPYALYSFYLSRQAFMISPAGMKAL